MANKFNIGRDLAVSISVNGVVLAQFGYHTDTHVQPQWTEKKIVPTNNGGVPVARGIFGGYNVDIVFARINGVADSVMQFLEDTFKSGATDPVVTMQETVTNDDGSVNQFLYIDGSMLPSDGGSFKGTDEVAQTIKFFFPERQEVGTTGTALTFGGGALSAGSFGSF